MPRGRRSDLPLAVRRRFLTGRPCLDLTHTGGDGEYARWEIIHDADDLARWLGVILDTDGVTASPDDLPGAFVLRGAITMAARERAAGRQVPSAAVEVINEAATPPALVPVLRAEGTMEYAAPSAAAALSTVARDAIDLFSGPLAARIRVCAADDCALLFVDASRPGRRRWCSMQRCGNLAKVREHRGKQS